jgi:lipid-binding SYLF domain-containing protein
MIERRLLALGAAGAAFAPHPSRAATRAQIDHGADQALARLFRSDPAAKALSERAVALLIFPEVVKAGLLLGGQVGEGVLRDGNRAVSYYRLTAVSWGLQVGAQTYSYVMMLMTRGAREYIDRSDGWEIGSGPSVVLIDQGMAARISSTTVTQDVLAFIFGQTGLMGGIGIEGSKISRFTPSG